MEIVRSKGERLELDSELAGTQGDALLLAAPYNAYRQRQRNKCLTHEEGSLFLATASTLLLCPTAAATSSSRLLALSWYRRSGCGWRSSSLRRL